jgi:hypothetical protein
VKRSPRVATTCPSTQSQRGNHRDGSRSTRIVHRGTGSPPSTTYRSDAGGKFPTPNLDSNAESLRRSRSCSSRACGRSLPAFGGSRQRTTRCASRRPPPISDRLAAFGEPVCMMFSDGDSPEIEVVLDVLSACVSWSGRRDSNSRPRAWEAPTLPTELRPLTGWAGDCTSLPRGDVLAEETEEGALRAGQAVPRIVTGSVEAMCPPGAYPQAAIGGDLASPAFGVQSRTG